MFGCQPWSTQFRPQLAFDPTSYKGHMQEKLAELQNLVEANLAEAAAYPKAMYDKHSTHQHFEVGKYGLAVGSHVYVDKEPARNAIFH